MTHNDYQLDESITGEGAQGTVVVATHTITGKQYVAKITNLKKRTNTQKFKTEVEILEQLKTCKYVVRIFDSYEENNCGVMILQKMSYDLMTLLEENILTLQQKLNIFIQVCKGIKEIHKKGIVHLDIKPENILVSADFSLVKLCDFGGASRVKKDNLVKASCGTLVYSAPEYYCGQKFDGKKADIWSLGILLHVLLSGFWPYEMHKSDLMFQVISASLVMFPELTVEQKSIISEMTTLNPRRRCDLSTVIKACEKNFVKPITLRSRIKSKIASM